MLDKHFILHLTLIEGVGPTIIQKIMQSQRSGVQTSDLYLLSQLDWMKYFGITEKSAYKLVTGLSNMAILEKELHLIEQYKIQWMTIIDESYPALLKEIHLPPAVLYFYGNDESLFSSKGVAIVGARKGNEYGQHIINTIVPDLVAAGYAIVSGGALGIDTMAHEVALQCGGKTIAVLGSGLLHLYPSQNKRLFEKIIESGGAIVSSFPLMMEPFPGNFPARNRIVTGLSRGCLVVQAAQKSGALISAHYAMEQGREVFAVPGSFDDELSAGCHTIIQEGAKLVMSSGDILSEFGEKIVQCNQVAKEKSLQQSISFSGAHPQQIQGERKKDFAEMYSESQQKIIAVCKQRTSLEDLIAVTNFPFEQVQSELFTLQLEGIVSQDFTGMWVVLED